ncbi:MAG: TolC family protein [Kordiimonadaceae bacterium]|nr:TolC family protein [Kordiimonadaceae bacterium]MBO6569156.1 TolC family protein [Kordiimonadaceae bacterium]MBO6964632.1 TolC family protein [Kordiimonadaceae bacterium]
MKVRLGLILSIAMMAQPLSAIEEDIEIIPVAESSYTAVAVKSIAQVAAQVVGPGGTTLDLLMKSVEVHAPQVIQAQASAEAAVARETIAQAPFDPILNGSYDGRMTGFYGGQVADVSVSQRLEGINATVYGGYSISSGTLPIYEDEYLTNGGGEIRAGARFALLRGREIDPQRIGLSNARLAAQSAEQKAALQILGVKSAAMQAYVQWLYAENTRLVYDELYTIALVRDEAIQKAIAAGQLASIAREENRQLLLARQSQKIRAEQQAMQAAMNLALYLRDQTGEPQAPKFGQQAQLPQQNPFNLNSVEEVSRQTLEGRPDFVAIGLDIEQLKAEERLTENDLQPNLELKYEFRRDFGDGSPTREGTDHKIGLNFNVPIELSRARGERSEVVAQLKSARAELRLLQDQVGLALRANQAGIVATEQQLDIGKSEVEIAEALQRAEEARYLAGASDVFRLNVQETALANSKLRVLNAQRDHDLLLVQYFAITGQFWF